MPRTVRNKAKEFFAEARSKSGITESQARAVLVKIKTLLSERGLEQDIGCQKLDEIQSLTNKISGVQLKGEQLGKSDPDRIAPVGRASSRGVGRGRRNHTQQAKTCFVGNKPGHFAADCRNQYCQHCGQWGHGIRSCQRPSVAKVDPTDPKEAYSVPEETAVVDVLIEGKPWEAMIDSGASLSVICIGTLRELDLQHKMKPKPETLRAFDNTSIQSVGQYHLSSTWERLKSFSGSQ